MKCIGEFMPDLESMRLVKSHDEEKCAVCGSAMRFFRDETKKPCQTCGTWVFHKFEKQSIKKRIECWVCLDQGIVQYPVQEDGKVYNHVARCNCPKGMKWEGTIPLLTQCLYAPKEEFLELRNQRMYNMVWKPA